MRKIRKKTENRILLLFLLFFAIIYPLYFRDGYTQITTYKYGFLKLISFSFGGVLLVIHMISVVFPLKSTEGTIMPVHKRFGIWITGLSVTDWFVILYFLVLTISYFLSDFREEALWGTDGWYMGFMTQLICIGIYYGVSRCYDGKGQRIWYLMIITFLIFLWGLLNRFSIYPVNMENASPEFISSIGNINWFCGYWSVFFGMGLVIYMMSEKTSTRICAGLYNAVALGLAAVEGSDSAFLSLSAVFLLLFFISFEKRRWLERYLELFMIMCGSCQVFRLIHLIFPEQINFWNATIEFLLGNATFVIWIMAIILRVLIEDKEQETLPKKAHVVKWILVFMVAVFLIGYVILLTINTKHPGSIGALSNKEIFIFNDMWGSSRGLTWKDGMIIFRSLPGLKKWIGAGPDCFTAYAYHHPAISIMLENQFSGLRLTNAHSELITLLVNTGVLGVVSFLGIFISSIVRLLKKALKNPICLICAVCAISYLIHNTFSFQQIVNTPFVFMMLGVGENMLRKGE